MKAAGLLLGVCLCSWPGVWAQTAPAESAQAKREIDLKMPEIIRALNLKDGSRIADIGAGDGYYDIPMSRAVGPGGRVCAEDISPSALKRLRQHLDENHLANVDVIEGVADDPKLPGSLDAVLMVISYHEIEDHAKMLQHVSTALKPGGRFVVVDMTPHKTLTRPRADQVKNHVIAPDLAQSEIRQAGFEVVSRDDHFIDNPDEESTRWMIVFRKPVAQQ